MSLARELKAKIIDKVWVTPTVMGIRFEPSKDFKFRPGQFLSIFVPDPARPGQFVKRAYSFSSPYEIATHQGYELCVKFVPGGLGTEYLASLNVGDKIRILAPYGDFTYKRPEGGRTLCFISTGTGISPFRSMVLSREFLENPPKKVLAIHGARTQDEILYPGVFESVGVQATYAVSQPVGDYVGFKGRITDYLRSLSKDWGWHQTDFFLCGNAQMVLDVCQILEGGHGVPKDAIFKEVFFMNRRAADRTLDIDQRVMSIHKKSA